jgi:hypothetical protein
MNKQFAKLAAKAGFDIGMHDGMILGNFSDMHKCNTFAQLIIEECAKIAEDCYTYHEPLSKVPGHIKKFERLTDENMRHKL